jgi:hypothetical protein
MLSSYSREALKKVSTATLTTVLFKRGLRNVFIQGIFLLNKEKKIGVRPQALESGSDPDG